MFDYYRQLSIFLEVVKAGSFRKAAKGLSITPSAVTHHVKKLEDEMGLRLYKRDLGRFELTQDGHQTVDTFSDTMNLLDQKYRLSKLKTSISIQTIRFSYASAIGTKSFYRFLSDYSRENPDVTLDLNVQDTREDIDESDKHLAIRVGWPETQPSGKTIPIKSTASHIFCSKEFSQENIIERFSDLESLRWIYMRGLPFPMIFHHRGKEFQVNPTNIIYVNNSSVAYELIYNSVGICTLLDFVIEADGRWDDVDILFPDHKLPERQVFLSMRTDVWENLEIQRFAEAVRNHFL